MTFHSFFFCNSINKNSPKHLYFIDTRLMTDITSPYRHDITEILLKVALNTINHHLHPVSTSFNRHKYMLYIYPIYMYNEGCRGRERMDLQLLVQSVPITTLSLIPPTLNNTHETFIPPIHIIKVGGMIKNLGCLQPLM
jgi:hypothetical protein